MERICTRCKRIIETEQCPSCGGTETRFPESTDECLIVVLANYQSSVFAEALRYRDIPFRMVTSVGKTTMFREFYVPYGRIDDAFDELEKLCEGRLLASEEAQVFTDEELDRMDISQLEGMDAESLKAFMGRIRNTMKAIKCQEALWKDRSNLLFEMKEEAELRLEDLS